jgi:membrane fusion protein (multidrug efflux system)
VSFELILDNGTVYAHPGHFCAATRQINVQTGTIEIQAVFPNPEDILRPGMYAKIRAQIGVRRDALLVPQSAVFEIQGQYEIASVGADDRITIHSVKPGNKVGTLWLIDQGVSAGERVVTEGVQDVKNGMQVRPIIAHKVSSAPSAAPAADIASPNPGLAQE